MSTFLENKNHGEKYENIFIEKYLESHIKKVNDENELECIETHPDGSFKDWDICVTLSDQSVLTYEVKCCRNSYRSGLMCLEYSYRDRPSGIAASKADYFVYISIINEQEENVYVVPSHVLKDKLTRPEKYKRIICGRIKQSKALLVPLAEIEKYLI